MFNPVSKSLTATVAAVLFSSATLAVSISPAILADTAASEIASATPRISTSVQGQSPTLNQDAA